MHPLEEPRTPYVTSKLQDAAGPVVAVSDYMRAVPQQIARWVPQRFHALGADGFGFADTRPAARRFFKIDAESVVCQALVGPGRGGRDRPRRRAEGARPLPDRRPDRGLRRQAGGRRRLSAARASEPSCLTPLAR